MAAHRIRITNNNNVLPRCKSEGTLIDLDEGVTEASLIDVKGQFIALRTHCITFDLTVPHSLQISNSY